MEPKIRGRSALAAPRRQLTSTPRNPTRRTTTLHRQVLRASVAHGTGTSTTGRGHVGSRASNTDQYHEHQGGVEGARQAKGRTPSADNRAWTHQTPSRATLGLGPTCLQASGLTTVRLRNPRALLVHHGNRRDRMFDFSFSSRNKDVPRAVSGPRLLEFTAPWRTFAADNFVLCALCQIGSRMPFNPLGAVQPRL